MNTTKKSISQKSTISIVIISVITGGIIALQDHFNKGYLAEQSHTYRIHDPIPLAPLKTIPLAAPVSAPSRLMHDDIQLLSQERILFDLASAQIKPAYFSALSVTAQRIKMAAKSKQSIWQIVGHADQSGSAEFNLQLAAQRAQAVADFLLDKGVQAAQLSVLSLGESAPLKFTQTRASNRRVEVHPYQAQVAALAKQLSRSITPAERHPLNLEQLQQPLSEQALTAATNLSFEQNPFLTMRSAVINF
ncbi:MAG: outer membrane protein OmpA-like peptidoglycan-associated protein [Psychromonas sp.]|jgi:outer membrane protein OmpA-like peptidoglycan-associated protein|uniref:OmpA family protein n=1 Tax=Psychromonas sp. TaxID=1884585 RepID=UPI0039E63101